MNIRETTRGIEKANQLLRQLRDDYLAELPERADDIEPMILNLEKSRHSPEIYEELYRAIHSLKGSAGTHGLTTISYVCHHFEDALNDLGDRQDADPGLIDNFLTYLDMIRRCESIAREESPDYSEVESTLINMRRQRQSGKCSGLIVESSSFMRNLYADSVDQNNIEFTVIEDGLEALGILLRDKYDFVIMGSETKSLNGIALLYALRAAGGVNKNIRTVMITSKNNSQFIDELAPEFYLQKDQELFSKLNNVLLKISRNEN